MSMQDEDPTAPQQGAIPADPAFASAPQGYTPPPGAQQAAPAAAPSGGGAIPTPSPTSQPSDAAGVNQDNVMAFLQGQGAAPQQELDQRVKAVSQGTSNHSEAVVHAIASADSPQEQGALIQAARQRYSAGMAHAGAALNAGDAQKAALFANAATPYVPDGNDLTFQAGKDGITATVTGLGGKKPQQFKLDPAQFHQFVTGPDSRFDAMMENPVQKALAKLGAGAPQAGAGAGAAPAAPPKKPGAVKTMPSGNQYQENEDGTLNPQTMGSAGTANPKFAGPNPDNGPISVVNAMDKNPATATRSFGNASQADMENPNSPQALQQRFTNNPDAQLAEAGKLAATKQEQESKLEVAKNSRLYGQQATANARTESATINTGGRVDIQKLKNIAEQNAQANKDPNIAGKWRVLSSMANGGASGDKITEQAKILGLDISGASAAPRRTLAPQPQAQPAQQPNNEPPPRPNAPAGVPIKLIGGQWMTRGPDGTAIPYAVPPPQ